MKKQHNPFEPEHIQVLMNEQRRRGKNIGNQGSTSVALAFHRGVHTGYLEGYADAKAGKAPSYKENM